MKFSLFWSSYKLDVIDKIQQLKFFNTEQLNFDKTLLFLWIACAYERVHWCIEMTQNYLSEMFTQNQLIAVDIIVGEASTILM